MNLQSRGKWLALLCLVPFAVFFIAFQIAPLAWVAINSLQSDAGWGIDNFVKAFNSRFYRQAMQYSLEISFWSSLIGIVIAILGSYSLRKVPSRLRDFVSAFANMTSNFSGVPLAFAFIILLGFNFFRFRINNNKLQKMHVRHRHVRVINFRQRAALQGKPDFRFRARASSDALLARARPLRVFTGRAGRESLRVSGETQKK